MNILIFNYYLSTGGGGELHSLELGRALKTYNKVTFVYEGIVEKKKLINKLPVDLKGMKLMEEKDLDDRVITGLSSNYDVFINSTYLSKLKGYAKKNAILIFFPPIPILKFNNRFKSVQFYWRKLVWKTLNIIENWEKSPYFLKEGVYKLEFLEGVIGQWTDDKLVLEFNKPGKGSNIVLKMKVNAYFSVYDFLFLIKSVEIDGKKIDFKSKKDLLYITLPKSIKPSSKLIIYIKTFTPSKRTSSSDTRQLGFFLENIFVYSLNPFRDLYNNTILKSSFKNLYNRMKLYKERLDNFFYLENYSLIISNSEYTSNWIQKYYRKKSEILYPPVDTKSFYSSKKEELIISVGRFFQGGHNKKQDLMIEAFKKLYDSDRSKYRNLKYHVCGGTHPEKKHQIYLNKVKEMASGYPIEIHTDISREELIKLYSKAKVFWHASGYGEDEEKDPDKFEHFGITTVEAMSAGCIPIVIAKAGQKEIIEDGVNGYLWEDVEELIEKTKKVLGSKEDKEMKEAALKRADYFSKANFEKRTLKIFNKFMED